MPLSAGMSLGRYVIVSPLGAGGMGEVYRAEDTLLNRQVAIKVLPEHLAENPESLKRFQKEAKALAALSHPNILAIYDFVSEQGNSFVVMELLDGQTLRARIVKSPLPWQKAVTIAVSIAEGLAAAHSKGVVHRDLKPENILLTSQGSVKILDFGLASLKPIVPEEELRQSPTISHVTESGIVMGTVAYMSPEQLRGEHADARSDIFSFGCVLYEMLAGKRPFLRNNAAETAAAILRDDPTRLTDIPPELDRILQHCLEKDAERRLHSAHDLAFALKDLPGSAAVSNNIETLQPLSKPRRKVPIIVAVVIFMSFIAALVVIGLHRKFISHPTAEKIESLAVLPLKNLSGDPSKEYFADGMTEELIAKLSRISALRVISRTSVMEYKGVEKKSLPEIAKELNVDAIVEGSVLQSGDRVRITAQLIHAPTDRHLWAESYEREMNDILALQNEVASAVTEQIRVKLTPQEQAEFAATPQVNPAAYEAYLRGINYLTRPQPTEEETRLCITMFERAIELDPSFARAYANLSMADSWMYHQFYDRTAERLAKAKRAVDRAFELQPDLPEAHIAMGYYHYWGLKNYDEALQAFSIAQKVVPHNKELLLGLGGIHRRQGNFAKALEEFKQVLELDPRDAGAADLLGNVYELFRRYGDAQRYYDLGISLSPDSSIGYQDKAISYLNWTGDTKGTRAIIMKIPDEDDRNENLYYLEMLDRNYQAGLNLLPLRTRKGYQNAILSGDCYRLMKKPEKARASYEAACVELEKLLPEMPEEYRLHRWLSLGYAGLNRKDEAISEAKIAVKLYPVSKDAYSGPMGVRNLAIIYVRVGEHEAALDQIEYLLSIPTSGYVGVSVPLLRIDPTWDPLRSHPRFQKILEQYSNLQPR